MHVAHLGQRAVGVVGGGHDESPLGLEVRLGVQVWKSRVQGLSFKGQGLGGRI